jgi:hypothetical protein
MAYRVAKMVVLATFALYALVAINLRGPLQDVYPIFSWSLFSLIPNPDYRFTIEVLEARGEKHNPPLRFSESKALFEGINQSPTQYTPRINRLGRALINNNAREVAEARAELEAVFGEEAFRYQVVMIYADPVDYWKSGSYRVVNILEEFASDKQP